MWPTPHGSIRALGGPLATAQSITGSGPLGTKLSALAASPRGGGYRLSEGWGGYGLDIGSWCSPEPEQIASRQRQQQQLDPET